MIYLTGFMGAGKSTLGPILAARLGRTFQDTDDLVERDQGISLPQIFRERGESHFRTLEFKVLRQFSSLSNDVIALGGGTLLSPECRELIFSHGTLIYLRAQIPTLIQRILFDSKVRPLVNAHSTQNLEDLFRTREPYYELAHLKVETDSRSPIEIADWVAQEIMRGTKND